MPAPRLILDWTLYRLALLLAAPLIPLRLLWRGRRERGYLEHGRERLGAADVPAGAIWIHAVSVGEMRAAQPLIEALRAAHPGRPVLLTCMTPTGRATAESLYGSFARIVYLPYDYACLVRRFLRRARPAVGILLETELWPNLIRMADKMSVPLMLANARLSERSARGYARLPALTRASLARIAVVAAQSEADAARLKRLGAREVVHRDEVSDAAGSMSCAKSRSRAISSSTSRRRPNCSNAGRRGGRPGARVRFCLRRVRAKARKRRYCAPSPNARRTTFCWCWCRAIRNASMKRRA